MQDLYALADALKPFDLSPSQVADVGVGRGLDTVRVMKLVALVCGIGVTQAKAVAIEAEYSMVLSHYQTNLFRDLAADPGE